MRLIVRKAGVVFLRQNKSPDSYVTDVIRIKQQVASEHIAHIALLRPYIGMKIEGIPGQANLALVIRYEVFRSQQLVFRSYEPQPLQQSMLFFSPYAFQFKRVRRVVAAWHVQISCTALEAAAIPEEAGADFFNRQNWNVLDKVTWKITGQMLRLSETGDRITPVNEAEAHRPIDVNDI